MKKCIVFKYLNGSIPAIPAGELVFKESGSPLDEVQFTYNRRYLRSANPTPVDPFLLPLESAPVLLDADLLGAIRDAAPDYWGRLVIGKAMGQSFESLHEMDYLLYDNAARIGDLDFRASAISPEPELGPPAFADIAYLLDVAEQIEQEQALTTEQSAYLQLFAQGSSLGGARPKCTVRTEDGNLWVAKFPSTRDRWSNARIEGATMTLAGACGIRVPELRLESIGGKDVLLVKRFDRDGEIRSGYMSGLSMLEVTEMDTRGFSYLTLADKLRRHTPADLEELFRRMVFNVLCRNTDDHPRNHGFLFDAATIRLAPAFDSTPNPSTPGVSTVTHLSMCVGSRGREATLENCLSESARFGLRTEAARGVIEDVKSRFAGWQQLFARWNVAETDRELFNHTFARWYEQEETPCPETPRASAGCRDQ